MDQGHVSFEDIRFKCSFVVTFKFSFFLSKTVIFHKKKKTFVATFYKHQDI